MQKLRNNIRNNFKYIAFFLILVLLIFSQLFVFTSIGDIIPASSLEDDNDGDGWNNTIERSYGTDIDNPLNFPKDTDEDGIPNEKSDDGKFNGDEDDDGDLIDDITEDLLGSNSLDPSDVENFYIDNNKYFLIEIDDDNIFDLFYNPIGKYTNIYCYDTNKYYIDFTGDDHWNYIYDNGDISKYILEEENIELPWIFIIFVIIFVILIIIFLLFKFKILYLYEEYVEK